MHFRSKSWSHLSHVPLCNFESKHITTPAYQLPTSNPCLKNQPQVTAPGPPQSSTFFSCNLTQPPQYLTCSPNHSALADPPPPISHSPMLLPSKLLLLSWQSWGMPSAEALRSPRIKCWRLSIRYTGWSLLTEGWMLRRQHLLTDTISSWQGKVLEGPQMRGWSSEWQQDGSAVLINFSVASNAVRATDP